jgi:hypothetical protein
MSRTRRSASRGCCSWGSKLRPRGAGGPHMQPALSEYHAYSAGVCSQNPQPTIICHTDMYVADECLPTWTVAIGVMTSLRGGADVRAVMPMLGPVGGCPPCLPSPLLSVVATPMQESAAAGQVSSANMERLCRALVVCLVQVVTLLRPYLTRHCTALHCTCCYTLKRVHRAEPA